MTSSVASRSLRRRQRRYGRYGYRRIAALLRDAGWQVNDKRVERIWRRHYNAIRPHGSLGHRPPDPLPVHCRGGRLPDLPGYRRSIGT